MTTVEQRIAKMRAERRKTWISDETYKCPNCGETFRYKTNLNKHCQRCCSYGGLA